MSNDEFKNGKITYRAVGIVFGVVTIVVGCVIWIFTALNAKADISDVKILQENVQRIELKLGDVDTKVGMLLDRR